MGKVDKMTRNVEQNAKPAMDFIEILERSSKPRTSGLTLIHDPGFGLQMVRAHLETAAPYLDYAKMRNVTPRLFPESLLRDKIALYREFEVELMFGGIVFEMAYLQGNVDKAIAYATQVGVKTVEISENLISLPMEVKRNFVRRYCDKGLEVFYEVGKKFPTELLEPSRLADEIHQFIADGVSKIILEQAELSLLFKSEAGTAVLKQLVSAVNPDLIIFETGNSEEEVWLINELGPDVNLGPNIKLDQVVWLEPTRRGLGRASGYTALTKYLHA